MQFALTPTIIRSRPWTAAREQSRLHLGSLQRDHRLPGPISPWPERLMTAREAAWRALYKLEAWRHNRAIAAVLRTRPVVPATTGTLVFSQVCARDFLMYLLAAKTFAFFTGIARFAILDDGSLTTVHHALLRHHLPGVVSTPISEVTSRGTPARGCWERLLRIVELGRDGYVIQLDADTLTLGPLPEVLDSVRGGQAFSLVAEAGARVQTIAEAVTWARAFGDPHVQIVAESELSRIDGTVATHYLRGCAAFTGLPPGDRMRDVEHISARMAATLGPRWSEWGTEQVTVNLLTANARDTMILQPPDYTTYEGGTLPENARFVHFIGEHRFVGATYRNHALNSIAFLLDAET